MGIVVELLTDGQHNDLVGGEPEREVTCCMLNKHGDEALHRPEGGTVNHDRAVLLVVCAGVL